MIPLATPRDNEILNLSQIIRVRIHEAGRCDECEIFYGIDSDETPDKKITHIVGEPAACTVYFSDGRNDIFTGDESKFLNIELHFLLNLYRQMQQAATSQIVSPNAQPNGGLVM